MQWISSRRIRSISGLTFRIAALPVSKTKLTWSVLELRVPTTFCLCHDEGTTIVNAFNPIKHLKLKVLKRIARDYAKFGRESQQYRWVISHGLETLNLETHFKIINLICQRHRQIRSVYLKSLHFEPSPLKTLQHFGLTIWFLPQTFTSSLKQTSRSFG